MRFVSDSTPLGRAATFAARHSAGTAAPIPALSGLRVSAGEDSVRLTGYDYEASSTVLFPAEVDEPGELLLPGRVFAEIVHALPQGRVRVHTREGVVEISAGASEFTLPTLPLADYPELPTPPAPVGALDAAPFARAVAQMSRIAIRGDAVPVLSGTLLEFDGESVTLTSSDRFRVAIHQVPWKATGSDLPARAVVPARMLADATKSLGAGTDLLTVGLGGEGEAVLSLGVGERLTTLRLLDDTYPALRTKVPTDFVGTVVLAVEELRAALRRVCIVADRYAAVVLTIGADEVVVGAAGDVDTRGRERLAGRLDGDAGTVAFNAGYLLDGLEGFDTEYVRLGFQEGIRPALLTGCAAPDAESEPDVTYVAMPRRLPA
ncbi:DNA polymerase-3 subunit beta [Actinopolymorpha cephalotaxi]|uniref:DNA polymerase-3 subunit beta n=1 Tax=Actinopolymorpha cephalotaxi TaxID=504797 RepID=A0A1I2XV43_9ACTN|nr:DNA polymerase III subunit beta [Actinopolymorpha cephalotaxi]NYH87171.1 DNA polymerase-3 subunit beta [Actinopolymorpha cephalotaxi]SFH16586.1 DNA polymerase-3 subunit beta [Actinopolymorpha cephalotaxi]